MEQKKSVTKLLEGKVTAKEIADFIVNLPKNVRKMLPEDEHELLDCIELLPNSPGSISKGRILKITIDNYLDCEDTQGKGTNDDRTGTSMGLLYVLDDNSEINIHPHSNDMETYVSIEKVLKMPKDIDFKEEDLSANICAIDQEHGIGPLPKGTLIGTFKVKKDYIEKLVKSKDRTELGPLYKKGSAEKAAQYDSQNQQNTER